MRVPAQVQAGHFTLDDSDLSSNRVHDLYISATNGECHEDIHGGSVGKVFRKAKADGGALAASDSEAS